MFHIFHTFKNRSLSRIQILEPENTQLLVFRVFSKYLTLYNVGINESLSTVVL